MEDTEANNTDAGKSTLEPLLHEQFLEARGRKERRSEHTCSDQSLMSCAEKSLRLKPELRRQFWGSIFSPFLASAPWPSSVAGFRFLDSLEHSLERTYSAHKIPEGCPFARPCFGVPKSHGNQLRAKVPRSTEDSHLLPRPWHYPTIHCPKNTGAIITRTRAPTAQRKPCEIALSYQAGPGSLPKFRASPIQVRGAKTGPQNSARNWTPLLRDKARSEFGDPFWCQN